MKCIRLGVCWFVLMGAFAQDVLGQEVQYRAVLVERPTVAVLYGTRTDLEGCISGGDEATCGGDVVALESDPYLVNRAQVTRDHDIVVRFFKQDGSAASAAEANVHRIVVRMPGMEDEPVLVPADNLYGLVDLITSPFYSELHSAGHRTLVSAFVQDEATAQVAQFHGRVQNRWEPYGIELFDADMVGVWLPVGIFATNFDLTDNGIEFAALPVGLALGGKQYVGRGGFYFGGSAIAMYSVMSVDEDDAGTTQQERIALSNAAMGALLDLGGLLYLTVTWHFDFANEDIEQKTMFGFGAGPALLRMIGGGGRAPQQ